MSQNIRKHRKEKGLSIQQLADLIDIDKNFYGQVSKMERGLVNPTISMVATIAKVLEIDITDLLKEK
ncbi:helix-turn-helix transcriptional regulator [Pedobacter sp. MC2016-15]|uniref:helix-turn-helix domain-containing protein n=1 Tax=Pedobacter sp. MC2016-15 TaxID=2994473 RepID=UPI0022450FC6|nr:helix-turn-helix transcriptional regulator [Pedobacter sp. MC2016-15]MCX2480972.1 helix-turn-helix transcriptional regulator [Pedobacter sp. MC2016-15]